MNSINVSYMKRVTTGPYEHEEMSVQFTVDKQNELESVTQNFRSFVYRTLGKNPNNQTITSDNSLKGEQNGEDSQKSSKQEKSSKKTSEKSSGEKVSEEVKTSAPEKETATEKTETPTPSKEEKSTKKAKADKVEGIPYDCDKEEHKSTLTNFLTKLTGGKEWAKDKEKSRKISRETLNGQPFLAKDGKILPSFEELCKTHYAGASADVL